MVLMSRFNSRGLITKKLATQFLKTYLKSYSTDLMKGLNLKKS